MNRNESKETDPVNLPDLSPGRQILGFLVYYGGAMTVYIASAGYSNCDAMMRVATQNRADAQTAIDLAIHDEATREFDNNGENWESLDSVLADIWQNGVHEFDESELTLDELKELTISGIAWLEC